jgi:hypothetical protein
LNRALYGSDAESYSSSILESLENEDTYFIDVDVDELEYASKLISLCKRYQRYDLLDKIRDKLSGDN